MTVCLVRSVSLSFARSLHLCLAVFVFGSLSRAFSLADSPIECEHEVKTSATKAYGTGYYDDDDGLVERVSIVLKDAQWSCWSEAGKHHENECLPAEDILVTRGSVNDT